MGLVDETNPILKVVWLGPTAPAPARFSELGNHALRALSGIVIGDDDGERKLAVRLLLLQMFQQFVQQARPLEGTNADVDMFLSCGHVSGASVRMSAVVRNSSGAAGQ
jgi:hypothetical protein